jgi:hypothetical protein
MVVNRYGDSRDTSLSRYVGPTEVVHRHGKLYLFDAGSGEMIAEFAPDAADKIRHKEPVRLAYDGAGHVTLED